MTHRPLAAPSKVAPRAALLALIGLAIASACSQSTNNPPPLKDVDGGGRDVRIQPFDGAIPEGGLTGRRRLAAPGVTSHLTGAYTRREAE